MTLPDQLSKRFDEAAIGLASRGQFNRHLEPRLWEDLRLRLQAIYRKATGEDMAVLTVDHNPAKAALKDDQP